MIRKKFTIILTIGTFISLIFNFFFRISSVWVLDYEEYVQFSLYHRTFLLLVPIVGAALHVPLTRQLSLQRENKEDLLPFAYNYLITAFLGFIGIFFVSFLLFPEIDLSIRIFVGLGMGSKGIIEFFLSIARGNDLPKQSALITSVEGISRVIILSSIYFMVNLKFQDYLIAYNLGIIISLITGIIITRPAWKVFKNAFNNPIKKYSKNIIKNYKDGFKISVVGFVNNSKILIIVYVAVRIMGEFEFKIFDLSLIGISLFGILASSITISINSDAINVKISNISQKYRKLNRLIFLLFIGLFLIYYFLVVSQFDNLFISIFFDQALIDLKYIRLLIFYPGFLILYSSYSGDLQALAEYDILLLSVSASALILVLISIVTIITGSILLLIFSLILTKFLDIVFIKIHLRKKLNVIS
jgi:O-antigen/teichoic acid export membrane protein